MLLWHHAGVCEYLWQNSGLDYIISTFTLPSADEERIGKYHTTDTAWTLCQTNKHREMDTPANTQTQIAHTESEKQIT